MVFWRLSSREWSDCQAGDASAEVLRFVALLET
jgi:hypothetical protein